MTVAPFVLPAPAPEMPGPPPAREEIAHVLEALVRLATDAQRDAVLARLEADRLQGELAALRDRVLTRLEALTPGPARPRDPDLQPWRLRPLQRPDAPLGPLGRRLWALLTADPQPVAALAHPLGVSTAAASQALAALRRRGLATSPRYGHWQRTEAGA